MQTVLPWLESRTRSKIYGFADIFTHADNDCREVKDKVGVHGYGMSAEEAHADNDATRHSQESFTNLEAAMSTNQLANQNGYQANGQSSQMTASMQHMRANMMAMQL